MPMVITKAGNLACKFIFHLAPKPDKSSWKSALEHCFQEAEKLQMRSLVLPPVGTGLYPAAAAANLVCFHRIHSHVGQTRVYFRPLKKGVVLPLAILKKG